jgi:hypothetical protein
MEDLLKILKTITLTFAALLVAVYNVYPVNYVCNNQDSLICLFYQYTPPNFDPADIGKTIYFDREYAISDISSGLKGLTILPNMCNNKAASADAMIWSFTLSEPCDVYLGFNQAYVDSGWLTTRCTWLASQGWQEIYGEGLTWYGEYLGNGYGCHTINDSCGHNNWYKKNGTQFDLYGQGGPEYGPVLYVVLVDAAIGGTGQPLQISSVRASNITATSAVVSWYTNESASSLVNYGLTSSYGNTATGPSGVTNHQVSLYNLTSNTTYHYKVTSSSSTTTRSSSDYTFTTTAPSVSISNVSVSPVSSTSVIVTWTTNIPSSTEVQYGLSSGYGYTASGTGDITSHSAQLTNLAKNTLYHFRVKSTAGTKTAYSPNDTFHTMDQAVRFYPPSLDFGDVAGGKSKSMMIGIYNSSSSTVFVDSVVLNDTHFTYSGLKEFFMDAGDTVFSMVNFSPSGTVSRFTANLTVYYNGIFRSCLLTGENLFTAAPRMVLEDSLLDFGTVRTKSNKILLINMKNSGPANLVITDVIAPAQTFIYLSSATFTLGPGDSTTLLLQFTPLSSDTYTDSLVFISNSYPENNVVLRVTGTGEVDAGINSKKESLPAAYNLGKAIPNPFNSSTQINFSVPAAAGQAVSQYIAIEIYDLKGRLIRTLERGEKISGFHFTAWDGNDNLGRVMPGGIYFCTMKGNNFIANKKLIIIR